MQDTLPIVRMSNYILRPLEAKDGTDLYDILCDKVALRYMDYEPCKDPIEAEAFIDDHIIDRNEDALPRGYVIVDKKTKHCIGLIDFHSYNLALNSAMIEFILKRSYWGQGITTMALKKMIKIGFEELGLDKITVGHMEGNIASKHVILNCDFKYESTEYSQSVDKFTDEAQNILYYSIYKNDYERGMLKWQ